MACSAFVRKIFHVRSKVAAKRRDRVTVIIYDTRDSIVYISLKPKRDVHVYISSRDLNDDFLVR